MWSEKAALITLTMITLIGFHCIVKTEDLLYFFHSWRYKTLWYCCNLWNTTTISSSDNINRDQMYYITMNIIYEITLYLKWRFTVLVFPSRKNRTLWSEKTLRDRWNDPGNAKTSKKLKFNSELKFLPNVFIFLFMFCFIYK